MKSWFLLHEVFTQPYNQLWCKHYLVNHILSVTAKVIRCNRLLCFLKLVLFFYTNVFTEWQPHLWRWAAIGNRWYNEFYDSCITHTKDGSVCNSQTHGLLSRRQSGKMCFIKNGKNRRFRRYVWRKCNRRLLFQNHLDRRDNCFCSFVILEKLIKILAATTLRKSFADQKILLFSLFLPFAWNMRL